MLKNVLRYLPVFLLGVCHSYSGFSQFKLTNFSYGPSAAFGGFFPQGNYLYFLNRSDATTLEWRRLDLTNTNTSTNVATLTSSHYQVAIGTTVIRGVTRFGNNIFSSAVARTSSVSDLEFDRFNISTANGSEQFIDIYPGSTGSDPIQFGQDPSVTSRIYFKPNTASGNQIWYWDETTSNATQLTNISGGIGQNSTSNIVVVGNNIYTAGTLNSYTGFIAINKTNGTYTSYTTTTGGSSFSDPRTITAANGNLFFVARSGTTSAAQLNLYMFRTSNNTLTQLTTYASTETTSDGNIGGLYLSPDKNTLFVNVAFGTTAPVAGQFLTVNTSTGTFTQRTVEGSSDRLFYFWGTNTAAYVQRFNANSTTSRTLYKINLSSGSATLVNTPVSAFTTFSLPVDGGDTRVYMSGTESVYGSEVYALDLLQDKLTRLTNINADPNTSSGNSSPTNLIKYNSNLYFSASATGPAAATADYEIYSINPSTLLPLRWLSFTAVPARAGGAQLSWSVDAVENVKQFEIEVSTEGTRWSTVQTVPVSSAKDYQYLDAARSGTVFYYRVKEVSADGTYTYTETRKVVVQARGADIVLLNNPSKNKTITLAFAASAAEGTVSVVDAGGRVVGSRQWNGGTGTLPIPVQNTGTYLVRFGSQALQAVVQ